MGRHPATSLLTKELVGWPCGGRRSHSSECGPPWYFHSRLIFTDSNFVNCIRASFTVICLFFMLLTLTSLSFEQVALS